MLELAKIALDEGDCTLAVANGGKVRKFYRRGVSDLLELLRQEPQFLLGASVADKIIGRAAASILIVGGAAEVFSRVVTHDALAMLSGAGILTEYSELADMVENRDKTGRCPLDSICATLTEPQEMVRAIAEFLENR